MENLIEDEERKIFLIVDNLRSHKSKTVMQWVSEHKDRIELFFLPPYSPGLNPDEYENFALKTDIRCRAPAQIEKFKDRPPPTNLCTNWRVAHVEFARFLKSRKYAMQLRFVNY